MAGRSSKLDMMDKKIPTNSKYENVKPVVDTGASITKYKEKIEEMKKNYRVQKNELFRRIKVSTFVQLVTQIADLDGYALPDEEDGLSASQMETHRSAFEKLATGEGELMSREKEKESKDLLADSPFLLVDVRDADDYANSHIISAVNYPHTLLSRGDNYQNKEMYAARNHDGKIVIVYDDDERMAPRVASVLVQRGYDNLFLLSGGLHLAKKLFPGGLTTNKEDNGTKKKFDEEDINQLSIYLDNVMESMSTSSRMSASNRSRMGSARSNASQSTNVPFR